MIVRILSFAVMFSNVLKTSAQAGLASVKYRHSIAVNEQRPTAHAVVLDIPSYVGSADASTFLHAAAAPTTPQFFAS